MTDVEAQKVGVLVRALQENPNVFLRLVAFINEKPEIGSATIRWRDGKVCALEETRQTY